MYEVGSTLLLLALMVAASYAGLRLQRRLREHHRSRETIDSVRLAITILSTFAALVLGLLVTSVKTNFDRSTDALRHLGVTLINLDARLREYGPQADPVRVLIRQYTASAIATTWPNERPPAGDHPIHVAPPTGGTLESTSLSNLLFKADAMIQHLPGGPPFEQRSAAAARDAMQSVLQARWTVIERAIPTISWPFLMLLMFWLVIIFAVFGLTSPRNGVIVLVLFLSAVSIASALYVVLDLDTPFSGFMSISSAPLRTALAHMDEPAIASASVPGSTPRPDGAP